MSTNQHWSDIREAGALSGLRIMAWTYRLLGRVGFNVVLAPVMLYFLLRRPVARQASTDYLCRVHEMYPDSLGGKPGFWTSFRHFLAFGRSLLDKYIAWTGEPTGIDVRQQDAELLRSIVDSGKGILLIGSHFGNLEYSRGISRRHPDLVINTLIYDQHAANFARLIGDAAPESRLNLIQVTDLDLDLALRLRQRVEKGEWLLIAGDRVPVGLSDNVCPATFLGAEANFPIGPYVLGNLLRCPVYMMHCYFDSGMYRLRVELLEEEIRTSRKDRQRTYEPQVQKFATALEAQVRRSPLQWFNFYDFWARQTSSARPAQDQDQDSNDQD
ncbi:MAG: acyltransferase [Woeseiaceae bacterium]|nr:acyltransferase [Woeseiaceae bacterium]NIP20840.1 acyltransferase [Woeseiaceae bacterium]NIS89633.1 acyltransferase [Woeseiaceae bacterium]